MPAAKDKVAVEKAAAAETSGSAAKDQPQEPLKQIQQLVEKKIRNLEKRKVSTDRPSPSHPLPAGQTGPPAQGTD